MISLHDTHKFKFKFIDWTGLTFCTVVWKSSHSSLIWTFYHFHGVLITATYSHEVQKLKLFRFKVLWPSIHNDMIQIFSYNIKIFKIQHSIYIATFANYCTSLQGKKLAWTLNIKNIKVHIFWEGYKISKISSPYFWLALHRTKVRWRFRKILWPSQNM